jgi:hypothetical protein
MAAVGLPLASNIGVGIYRSKVSSLHLTNGRHFFNGIMEIPVTTYSLSSGFFGTFEKCLTLVGSSYSEFKSVLNTAEKQKVSPIVILTHAFDFVTSDTRYRNIRPHPSIKQRFKLLCKHLSENRTSYNVVTWAEQADVWLRASGHKEWLIRLGTLAIMNRLAAKTMDRWTRVSH